MPELLCTIVVTSFNHADYVGKAVESALAQTYPLLDIIAVDDGSRDASLSVLNEYKDRIRVISKPNGGQASAMNCGFGASRGDIIFFLDCDDVLFPDTVQRVVAGWRPTNAKAQYRLQIIAADGAAVEGSLMPPYRPLPCGDSASTWRRFGYYPAPPTSGNAYSRRLLESIMPIPETEFRAWPDTFLNGVAPLFGDIATLPGLGGCWRQYEGNYSRGGLAKVQAQLDGDEAYIATVRRLGSEHLPRGFAALWPRHLRDQLLIKKFGEPGPTLQSSFVQILLLYLRTVMRWPEYGVKQRARFTFWAMIILLVPSSILRRLPGAAGPNVILS